MKNSQEQARRSYFHRLVPGIAVMIFTLAAWLPLCSSQDKTASPAPEADKVLATVNGKPITESEIRTRAADQFATLKHQFETEEHKVLEDQLDMAINESLLEIEAKARDVSAEKILAEITAPEVTDAQIDAFYEANKAQIPRPKEQVAGQIKEYLQQTGLKEARQKFYADLEAKYKVDRKLEPLRIEVAAKGPARGPAQAPVTIVEFSDFQCPFCGRLFPTLQQVEARYGDKVRIVFRQFPLSFHQYAQKAAEASLCAAEQGKFWEMHDLMFGNQRELAVDNLKAGAAKLGLDAPQFNTCLDSGKYVAQIQADINDGKVAGVNGTPALFINGRFVNGAVPLDQITSVIDDELRRKSGKQE